MEPNVGPVSPESALCWPGGGPVSPRSPSPLGVGRLLPELAPDTIRWPHAILGVAFAVYGIARFVLGQRRWIDFERGLGAHPGCSADRLLVVFTGAGVILGLGALVVIVAQ